MNIRDARFVINPDARFQPTATKTGYVQVFAVAPGCLPIAVGSLYTCLYRGKVKFLSPNGDARVDLETALAQLKAAHPGNYEMQRMSEEMRQITLAG